MKLTKLAVVGITTATLLSVAAPALAAETTVGTPAAPKSSVKYVPSEGDNDVTVPDTKPPVIVGPDEPGGQGQVMIVSAPKFNFGEQELTTKTRDYSAKITKLKKLDSVDEYRLMPPLVQISDTSGRSNADAKWALNVSMSNFIGADKSELAGATIKIGGGAKVYNSVVAADSATDGSGLVAVPNVDGLNWKKGVVLSSTATELLSAKNGKGNALTSYVMDSAYTGDKVYAETDTFDDVQLNVPGSTVKAVQTYEATVTWALSLTPEA
ncbi:WxL domain-containing protein [Carnobacterium divergens]|uniref:WxL domain-containing protein n=1 Tax=Carnobacterium divergens TaxID=2748 RepID=UPI0007F378A9|nr:WxL domain-containing protein [Carnobacterium divergens]MCO6019027.1 WxL domain-containing protein [Carnobacterium divergens]TFI65379.1 WxL domain-containing protein [Carnobacterium divergens]TFI92413.1 WxL domain-containing protein [Carnobacterium divergens]TFJ07797.1 WxL domain-containing protein [Carnobacterium divergens]TFJ08832.1 WxL domain-containing protein [Carnobacterium divergens]